MVKLEHIYLFGIFLGIILYMIFFSKTIVKISVDIILFIKKIVYSVLKVITYPLKVIFNFGKKFFLIPYNFFYKLKQNATNALKKRTNKT